MPESFDWEKLVALWYVRCAIWLFVAFVANFIAKRGILQVVRLVITKSKNTWDDVLLEKRVFERLSHLAPAIILYSGAPMVFSDADAIKLCERLAVAYSMLMTTLVVDGFLNAIVDWYQRTERSKSKPIRGYVQIVKLIIYLFAAILIISNLMDRDPWKFLAGLGGMTAILLLVFKDTILGLVASVQLSANDMVRRGDWLEMPKYGADGDVLDITLMTVKVQNWDKTITTIPTYALVSDSFKNWRGMSESGGRRIKRALNIDMASVRFCDEDMLSKFKKYEYLQQYLNEKLDELNTHNGCKDCDMNELVNGRRLTNIGTYRAYMQSYLRNHPNVHKNMTFLVRHLAPGPEGLPIEIYVFSNDQVWANYEAIQADIFDHLLAVLPEFGLRVFQSPTGFDMREGLGRSV